MKKEYLNVTIQNNNIKTLKYLKTLFTVINKSPDNFKKNKTMERLANYKKNINISEKK